MDDEIRGSWTSVDPEYRRRFRQGEIERISGEIARLEHIDPENVRLADLARDLDILQQLEAEDGDTNNDD